jgi:lipopolysaccharide export system permease protein
MIFASAARREFAHTAAGISVALLAVLTSTQLIRLLNDAVGGRIAPEAVLALLGFAALNFMPVLLALTLFVAVLLCLSRSYRDSEMVVWFVSGQPLTAWIRPVLVFSAPIVLAIAFLSTFLSPWANLKSAEYRDRLSARSEASQVAPGAFRETSSGQRVVFVENQANGADAVNNVFVSASLQGKMGVVIAASGHAEQAANGDHFMVLEKGRRYEVEPGQVDFRIMEFDRYAIRVQDAALRDANDVPSRMSLPQLLADHDDGALGELLWRISMPVSALILALLAIPLSFVNPRGGRSGGMLLAILIYAIYNNLISVSQAWVAQGKLSFGVAVWLVHVVMLLPIGLFFYRRLRVGGR